MPGFGPNDAELDYVTVLAGQLIAPDPAGLEPRRSYSEFDVLSPVSMNGGPPSNYIPEQRNGDIGTTVPPPGPPATAFALLDVDSDKWWGKGYETVWSGATYFPYELPANVSPDIYSHVDIWNITDIGRNPNIARDEPIPWSETTRTFNPNRLRGGS